MSATSILKILIRMVFYFALTAQDILLRMTFARDSRFQLHTETISSLNSRAKTRAAIPEEERFLIHIVRICHAAKKNSNGYVITGTTESSSLNLQQKRCQQMQ